MSQLQERNSVAGLMDQLGECLTPEVARRIADLRAAPEIQQRIATLADKCSEGELTPEEESEYDALVNVGTFIALLQARARKVAGRPAS